MYVLLLLRGVRPVHMTLAHPQEMTALRSGVAESQTCTYDASTPTGNDSTKIRYCRESDLYRYPALRAKVGTHQILQRVRPVQVHLQP